VFTGPPQDLCQFPCVCLPNQPQRSVSVHLAYIPFCSDTVPERYAELLGFEAEAQSELE
jgi:hypothetical protein